MTKIVKLINLKIAELEYILSNYEKIDYTKTEQELINQNRYKGELLCLKSTKKELSKIEYDLKHEKRERKAKTKQILEQYRQE